MNTDQGVSVNTSWLEVKHVDEIVSAMLEGDHVVIANPELAWGLLLWANSIDGTATMHYSDLPPKSVPLAMRVFVSLAQT